MYRLVVALMILSLSGSESASSSESDWSSSVRNNEIREPREEDSPVCWADYKLKTAMKFFRRTGYSEFETAEKLSLLLSLPGGENNGRNFLMRQILSNYAKLESLDDTADIICEQEEIYRLIDFQISLNYGEHEGSDTIDLDMDLHLIKRVLELSQKFFTHCMTRLTNEFDSLSEDSELKGAIKRMGEFEIFIDKEKEAQRRGFPRYCNEEIQVINLANFQRLANILLIKGGKVPVSTEGNELPPDAMEEVGKLFASTCEHEKFGRVRSAMEFIMEAKRSVRFNRESNLQFDCGKKMGRFQLCEEARKRIMVS